MVYLCTMEKAVTNGVEISVQTQFAASHSSVKDGYYFFAYTITIENRNDFAVQLLSRRWHINDSNGEYKMVEGEGVIGEQPVIEAGKKFTYTSGCNLRSEVGKMSGVYDMIRLFDNSSFQAKIPEFSMVLKAKLN